MNPNTEPSSDLNRRRVVGRLVSGGIALIGALTLISGLNDSLSGSDIVLSNIAVSLVLIIFGMTLYFYLERRSGAADRRRL